MNLTSYISFFTIAEWQVNAIVNILHTVYIEVT